MGKEVGAQVGFEGPAEMGPAALRSPELHRRAGRQWGGISGTPGLPAIAQQGGYGCRVYGTGYKNRLSETAGQSPTSAWEGPTGAGGPVRRKGEGRRGEGRGGEKKCNLALMFMAL